LRDLITQTNLNVVARELVQHGREVYTDLVAMLEKTCRKQEVNFVFPTFYEARDMVVTPDVYNFHSACWKIVVTKTSGSETCIIDPEEHLVIITVRADTVKAMLASFERNLKALREHDLCGCQWQIDDQLPLLETTIPRLQELLIGGYQASLQGGSDSKHSRMQEAPCHERDGFLLTHDGDNRVYTPPKPTAILPPDKVYSPVINGFNVASDGTLELTRVWAWARKRIVEPIDHSIGVDFVTKQMLLTSFINKSLSPETLTKSDERYVHLINSYPSWWRAAFTKYELARAGWACSMHPAVVFCPFCAKTLLVYPTTNLMRSHESGCAINHWLPLASPPVLRVFPPSRALEKLGLWKESPWRFAGYFPHDMADAGLTPTPERGCVECLDCGIRLKAWDTPDDPIEEHHAHAPECHTFYPMPKLRLTCDSEDF
jgi:hypothetical protein